jgi:polysaccharide pyruvyl transferase WcaK-like protein
MNIFVIGYYDHKNLGDEQYKLSFVELFNIANCNCNVTFIDCDKLQDHSFCPSDIIILGGGDILNEYFLDKIIEKFYKQPNKIIAISVGLPYTSILLNTNKLSIIDHLFIRCYQDLDLFSKYFEPHRINYIPDLAYLLTIISKQENDKQIVKQLKSKNIVISLSQHISKTSNYAYIINSFVYFFRYLLTENYNLTFVAFNTNEDNSNENDILIHDDIKSGLLLITPQILMKTNVTFINDTSDVKAIFNLWKTFDYAICMRFHACIFSLYNNIPFLPIYTTRKIDNLIKDINYNHSYKLETDHCDLPTGLDLELLMTAFQTLRCDKNVKSQLYNYNMHFTNLNFRSAVTKLHNIISKNIPKIKWDLSNISFKVYNTNITLM